MIRKVIEMPPQQRIPKSLRLRRLFISVRFSRNVVDIVDSLCYYMFTM